MIKRLILITLLAALPVFAWASPRPDYSGNYELAGHVPDRIFKLSLTQKGSRVHAVFFAADLKETGAQPLGEGDGRVNDEGILEFKFKDNLANKGNATFSPDKKLYRFEMRVTTIADIAPLHFYGVLSMKKVGATDVPKTSITML